MKKKNHEYFIRIFYKYGNHTIISQTCLFFAQCKAVPPYLVSLTCAHVLSKANIVFTQSVLLYLAAAWIGYA